MYFVPQALLPVNKTFSSVFWFAVPWLQTRADIQLGFESQLTLVYPIAKLIKALGESPAILSVGKIHIPYLL